MIGRGRSRQRPLDPDLIRAIDDIEPIDHRPDFWDRLDAALDDDRADPIASTGLADRPPFLRRALAVAAVAVLVAFAMAAVRQRSTSPVDRLDAAEQPTLTSVLGADPPTTTPRPDSVEASDLGSSTPPATAPPSAAPPGPAPSSTRTTATNPVASTPATAPTTPPTPTTTQTPPTDRIVPPAAPQRLEAEEMATKTYGGYDPDAYRLYVNGHVEDQIVLEAGGEYRLVVRAKGFSATGFRPEMVVSIDGGEVYTTSVDVDGYRIYSVDTTISAGSHQLRVAFTNDPMRPDNDVDLIIDWVEVSPVAG